jgi:hypothetical protein
VAAVARGGASVPRVCVVARSGWSLWDDAGEALYDAVTRDASSRGATWHRFAPDAPAGCSPLAFAAAAAGAHAVVAADVSRADAPGLVPAAMPWVTWVTNGRVPPARSAGPRDRLLLADAAWQPAALAAGWPASGSRRRRGRT